MRHVNQLVTKMSDDETMPVYISSSSKRVVKSEAGLYDLTMKDVIERLVEHGIENDLHRVPVDENPDEYELEEL